MNNQTILLLIFAGFIISGLWMAGSGSLNKNLSLSEKIFGFFCLLMVFLVLPYLLTK